MKKLWIAALLGLMLALSGCGGEKTEDAEEAAAVEEGQYKIEIFTAESTAVPVNTTEDPTVIQKLLESPEWERITEVDVYKRQDIEDAVDAYTIGSAYNEFAEDFKGRLKPGYLADMAVLDTDIFTCRPEEIRTILPVMTIVDGQIVYRKTERCV